MNPVQVLESHGWYNENKRITAAKVGNRWKLTFRDTGVLGKDTFNYVMAYLQNDFKVISYRFSNPPIPKFILVWSPDSEIDHKPKYDHYMTLWLTEIIK